MPIDIFPPEIPALSRPFLTDQARMKKPESFLIPEALPFVEHLLQLEEKDTVPQYMLRPDAQKRLETPGVLLGLDKLLTDPGLNPNIRILLESLLKLHMQAQPEVQTPADKAFGGISNGT